MYDDRINYVLVGGFVVAVLAGLVLALALLTGRTGATDAYYTRFDDATGLKYGSKVLYMGYPVGQVEAIDPVVENGKVNFDLTLGLDQDFASWSVPADSVAQVRAEGLLAAIAIDIRSGSSAEALRPGDRIIGRARRDVLAAVSDTANTVRDLTIGSVKPLLENLNRYVSSFGSVLERRGAPLIENLSTLSGELAGRAPEVIDDFLATTKGLRDVGGRLELLLSDDNTGKLGSVVDNVLSASEDVAKLTGDARTQVGRLLDDAMIAQVTALLASSANVAGELEGMSRETRAGLADVLAKDNRDHVRNTLANADAATVGLREMVGPQQQRKLDMTLDNAVAVSASLQALVDETREQVRKVLGPDTVKRFDRTLVNVSQAAANLARLSEHVDARVDDVLTPDMAARMRAALVNFSRAAGNVATLTGDLNHSRENLDGLLVSLRDTSEENREGVRASVQGLRYNLEVVAQHIDAVAGNLEGTSRNLLEFSRRLKANPGLLLKPGPPAPDGAQPGG